MAHRNREWERVNWEQSRPGDSTRPLGRGIGNRLLDRPLRTMLIIVSVSALFLLGSYAIFGYGDPALSADHQAVAGTLEVDATICCAIYREIDGQEYVFLSVLDKPGFFSTTSQDVSLRVIHLDPDGVPEQVAALDAPIASTLPNGMALDGSTLYVPLSIGQDDESGIWVVDVSDVERPEEIALLPFDERFGNLTVDDDLLIAHSAERFVLFDISAPGELIESGTLERPQAGVRRIQIEDERLYYLAFHAGQVRIADISVLEEPRPLGRYQNPAAIGQTPYFPSNVIGSAEDRLDATAPSDALQDSVVEGDYLYVAASNQGLEIVDVTDPTSPDTLGDIQFDGRAVRTAIAEGHLYVVTADEHSRDRLVYEVHQFDLVDPASPGHVKVIDDIRAVPGRQALETGGGYVFLGLNDTLLVLEPGN